MIDIDIEKLTKDLCKKRAAYALFFIYNRILNDGTFKEFEKKSILDLNDPDLLKNFESKNILTR